MYSPENYNDRCRYTYEDGGVKTVVRYITGISIGQAVLQKIKNPDDSRRPTEMATA